jgi:hypothetical protein
MFQLIESVALCFDEIGMGMRAGAGFTAKSPNGMGKVPQPTSLDCFESETEWFRIAVIEVDCKEETAFFGLG